MIKMTKVKIILIVIIICREARGNKLWAKQNMLFEKEHYYAENKAHCFYFGEKKPQEKSEQIQYVFNYCFSQLVSGRSSATNPAI